MSKNSNARCYPPMVNLTFTAATYIFLVCALEILWLTYLLTRLASEMMWTWMSWWTLPVNHRSSTFTRRLISQRCQGTSLIAYQIPSVTVSIHSRSFCAIEYCVCRDTNSLHIVIIERKVRGSYSWRKKHYVKCTVERFSATQGMGMVWFNVSLDTF